MKDKLNTKNTSSTHSREYSKSHADQLTTREHNLVRGFLLNVSLAGRQLSQGEKQELFDGIIEVLDWVHNRSVTEEEFSTLFMEWQKSKSLLNCLHPRVELLVTMDTCLSTLMGRSKSAKETVSKCEFYMQKLNQESNRLFECSRVLSNEQLEAIEQIYMKFDCERVGYIHAYQLLIIENAIRDEQNQYLQYDAEQQLIPREQLDGTAEHISIQSALQWESLVPLISLKACPYWQPFSLELLARTASRLDRILQQLQKHFPNIPSLSFDFLTSAYSASSHLLTESLHPQINPLSSPQSLHILFNPSSNIQKHTHKSDPFLTLFYSFFKNLLDYCTENRYDSSEYFDSFYHNTDSNANNTHQSSISSQDNCRQQYPQIFRSNSKYFQTHRNTQSSKQLKKVSIETIPLTQPRVATSRRLSNLQKNEDNKCLTSKTRFQHKKNNQIYNEKSHTKQSSSRSSSLPSSPSQINQQMLVLKRVVNIKLDASLLASTSLQGKIQPNQQNQQKKKYAMTTKASEQCRRSKERIFEDPKRCKDPSRRDSKSKQNNDDTSNKIKNTDKSNSRQKSSSSNPSVSPPNHEKHRISQFLCQQQRKQLQQSSQQQSQSQANLLARNLNSTTTPHSESSKCLSKTYTIIETLENMHHHPSGAFDVGSSKLA